MGTIARLVWGYLRHRPLAAALPVGLVALGTGLLSLLLLLDRQLSAQFDRNLAGVDMVIGAKGSPLQLVTSTIYHADAPTGNVPVASVKPFARPGHPLIGEAVPLALGDSYRGRRIVGTTKDFFGWYDARLAEGRLPEAPFEVVVGARAAATASLGLGQEFQSAHGLDDNEDLTHANAGFLEVVGVLSPTGLVIDELIVTPVETVWAVHDHHAADAGEEPTGPAEPADPADPADSSFDESLIDQHSAPEDHSAHEIHDAHDVHQTQTLWFEREDKTITALLTKFSARNTATLNFARNLNENTDLMAATPPVVMAQFSEQVAGAEAVVRALGSVILVASILSLFVILLNALRDRLGDLALLRSLGATPGFVFGLVLAEGVFLAALGALIGLLGGRLLFYVLQLRLAERYPVGPLDFSLHVGEPGLVGLSLVAALVAALLPAWWAYQMDPGLG